MSSFFFSSKKAQGMSLNVVVVAVIVLIILVVLIVMFSSKIKFFGTSTVSCANKGASAVCKSVPPGCGEDDLTHRGTDCDKMNPPQVCCVPFGGPAAAPAAAK
jgi:hypothetical protein